MLTTIKKRRNKHREDTDIFSNIGSLIGRMYKKLSLETIFSDDLEKNHKHKVKKHKRH